MKAKDRVQRISGEFNLSTNPTVLLVEDDEDVARFVMGVLRQMGANSLHVRNGAEALRLFHEQTFDVVASDIRMPVMDGFEFMHELHAKWSSVPVIFITAWDEPSVEQKARDEGVYDFIEKPVRIRRLWESVSNAYVAAQQQRLRYQAERVVDGKTQNEEDLTRRFQEALTTARIGYEPVMTAAGKTFGYEAFSRIDQSGAIKLDLAVTAISRLCELGKRGRSTLPRGWMQTANASLFFNMDTESLRRLDLNEAKGLGGLMSRLIIEISEQSCLQLDEKTLRKIILLKELGVRFAVDKISGREKLLESMLLLQPEFLKLGPNFAASSVDPRRTLAARKSIAMLRKYCDRYGAILVAEGVHKWNHFQQLRAAKVDLFQGFFFTKPAPWKDPKLSTERVTASRPKIPESTQTQPGRVTQPERQRGLQQGRRAMPPTLPPECRKSKATHRSATLPSVGAERGTRRGAERAKRSEHALRELLWKNRKTGTS